MAYEILKRDGFVEVLVTGETSLWELFGAVRKLRDGDPRKEVPDLWVVSDESRIPISLFSVIVRAVQLLCTKDMVGKRTALLACNELHRAMLDMYRREAEILPFEVRVFTARDEAVRWLTQ